VAPRSKAWVCGRSIADIADSNPSVCMDVCFLWVLCVVITSSREVLPIVYVCVCVCVRARARACVYVSKCNNNLYTYNQYVESGQD
jgi:hypothetical protein